MSEAVVVGGREGANMPECLGPWKTIEITRRVDPDSLTDYIARTYPPHGEGWPGHIVVSGELWEHIQAGYGSGCLSQGDGFLRFQMTDRSKLWALYGIAGCEDERDVHFDLIDSGVSRDGRSRA